MISYFTPTYADADAFIAALISDGYLLNGETPIVDNLKLNNIITLESGEDGYADMVYLGNIPDAWNDDLEPISYTDYVVVNIATAYSLSFANEYVYINRWLGQPVEYPEQLPIDTDLKTVIVDFYQKYLIPFSTNWSKAKLLERLAEFVR